MAPKTQQNKDNPRLSGPTLIDIDPETGLPFDDDDREESLENDQDKLLDAIIDEFGASDDEVSYKASITRVPKNFQRGQREPWLFECDAAEIQGIRSKLRDAYGGGLFRIRVYKNQGGKSKLYRQMDYAIEVPVSVAAPTGDAKYDALSQALDRTQQQLLALAERLSNPAQLPAPINMPMLDPISMMEKMSVIMGNMAGGKSSGGELDTFLKAAEFVQNIKGDSGSGGDSENIYSVIKALVSNPGVAEIATALRSGGNGMNGPRRRMMGGRMLPGPGMQRQQQPNQSFQQAENIPPNAKEAGDLLQTNMIYLINKARQDADPGLYAEWMLDNTPENLIVPLLNDPGALDQLQIAFPAMVPFRQWFEELRASALSLINGEGQPEGQNGSAAHNPNAGSNGASGNDSHVENNGGPGAAV